MNFFSNFVFNSEEKKCSFKVFHSCWPFVHSEDSDGVEFMLSKRGALSNVFTFVL